MDMVDRLLVVKIGGGEGLDLSATCDDLAQIANKHSLVVVHGVSATMNQICQEQGVEVQALTSPSGHSSRYTPPPVRDIYARASTTANEQVVAALHERGVRAYALLGSDLAITAERKKAIRAVVNGRIRVVRDDCTGSIRSVNESAMLSLLVQGQVPVLPPMAVSADGYLNIDGDRAGAAVASALAADTLVILSNVKGLYRSFPDESSIVADVPRAQMQVAEQWALGRMKRKVIAAREALDGGVRRVIIADGRDADPVTRALAGAGTRFTA